MYRRHFLQLAQNHCKTVVNSVYVAIVKKYFNQTLQDDFKTFIDRPISHPLPTPTKIAETTEMTDMSLKNPDEN